MAVALQRLVRRAVLPRLKGNADLIALVPAAQINPSGEPTWPFILLRAPRTQQLNAACLRGGIVVWDIHAFSAGRRSSAKALIETAEDHAGRIGGAIEATLANQWIDLEGGGRARIRLSDMRLLEDGTPDRYHYFAQINARVLAA